MKTWTGIIAATAIAASAGSASGVVFISEVFTNPPGSFDDTHEFIELRGTPGKKLDGFGIAAISGGLNRFFPLGSIVGPVDNVFEIDEFFSLDGLSLGTNGILVLSIGPATNYLDRSADSAFRQNWGTGVWNGYRDTVGKLENDGSKTMMLIRNRPGATQATHPNPPASPTLRWGKDINVDAERDTPVFDPQTMMTWDQYGNGSIDDGGPANYPTGGFTLDLLGTSTPAIDDDLEVVDEVSYEQDRGWEHDIDERHVDLGSSVPGLPYRHVHALDDPQGFNPDVLIRVDYRTKGEGWVPAAGAVGEMGNGNNWQDTATEQWIRGESVTGTGPRFYLDIAANTNPDAIQPYVTNVPLWLNDGVPPDFNFSVPNSYQITPGQVNPLEIPFIPGDANRDGVCDAEDIAKIAAVFGDDNWIFSNAFPTAPEGDGGDPATQTRPWNVDATGNNGIEPSDLQWTLNFQGNSNGRIVGISFDKNGPTPAGQGVYLNPSLPVVCAVTAEAALPSGRTADTLQVGDVFTIDVRAQVTGGVITAVEQENGVMQFVNDAVLSAAGVLRITGITPLGAFSTTRGSIQQFLGTGGDLGVSRINGYTTSFTQGLGSPSGMYRLSLEAIGEGAAAVQFSASTFPKFAASTPAGLKVGHTNNNGNPGAVAYPLLGFTVVPANVCCPGDANDDSVIDFNDITSVLANWLVGYGVGNTGPGDANCDGTVDFNDITTILANWLLTCP